MTVSAITCSTDSPSAALVTQSSDSGSDASASSTVAGVSDPPLVRKQRWQCERASLLFQLKRQGE